MNKKTDGKNKMKLRTIISLFTSWMFLVMGITGLVLYVVPQGRIAYWVDWRFLGLTKTQWGDIHIVTSVLFLVAGGWHLYYNWRVFLNNLRHKAAKGLKLKKELFLTTVVTLFVSVSAVVHLPPFSYLLSLNEAIKRSWIEDDSYEPPVGHAELLSLKSLCKKTDIDVKAARDALKKANIKVGSNDETILEIAENNGMSPKDVFAAMKDLAKEKSPMKKIGPLSADDVFERFEGKGVGEKTVAAACEMAGDELTKCLARLAIRNIEAEPEDTMKEVASRSEMRPIQVLQAMLVD